MNNSLGKKENCFVEKENSPDRLSMPELGIERETPEKYNPNAPRRERMSEQERIAQQQRDAQSIAYSRAAMSKLAGRNVVNVIDRDVDKQIEEALIQCDIDDAEKCAMQFGLADVDDRDTMRMSERSDMNPLMNWGSKTKAYVLIADMCSNDFLESNGRPIPFNPNMPVSGTAGSKVQDAKSPILSVINPAIDPVKYYNVVLSKLKQSGDIWQSYISSVDEQLTFMYQENAAAMILSAKRKNPHYGVILKCDQWIRTDRSDSIAKFNGTIKHGRDLDSWDDAEARSFSNANLLSIEEQLCDVFGRDSIDFIVISATRNKCTNHFDSGFINDHQNIISFEIQLMVVVRKTITEDDRKQLGTKFPGSRYIINQAGFPCGFTGTPFGFVKTCRIKEIVEYIKSKVTCQKVAKQYWACTLFTELSSSPLSWPLKLSIKSSSFLRGFKGGSVIRVKKAMETSPQFNYQIATYPEGRDGVSVCIVMLRLYAMYCQLLTSNPPQTQFETFMKSPGRWGLENLKKKEKDDTTNLQNVDLAKQTVAETKIKELPLNTLSSYSDFMKLPSIIFEQISLLNAEILSEMVRPESFIVTMTCYIAKQENAQFESELKKLLKFYWQYVEDTENSGGDALFKIETGSSSLRIVDSLLADGIKINNAIRNVQQDRILVSEYINGPKKECPSGSKLIQALIWIFMYVDTAPIDIIVDDEASSKVKTFVDTLKMFAGRLKYYDCLCHSAISLSGVTTTFKGVKKTELGTLAAFFKKVFDPSWQKAAILISTGLTNDGKTFAVKNLQRLLLQLNGAVIGSVIDQGFVRVDNLGLRYMKIVEEFKGNIVGCFQALEANGKQLCKNNAVIDARLNLTVLNCDLASFSIDLQGKQLLGKRGSPDDVDYDLKNIQSRIDQVKSRSYIIEWQTNGWTNFKRESIKLCKTQKGIQKNIKALLGVNGEEKLVPCSDNQIFKMWNYSTEQQEVEGSIWGLFLCESAGWAKMLSEILQYVVEDQSTPVSNEFAKQVWGEQDITNCEFNVAWEDMELDEIGGEIAKLNNWK